MEIKIKMVSAASEALNFRKQKPNAIDEETFQYISDFIESQKINNQKIKIAMVASAEKALKMARENPNLSDKELLKRFMDEIPDILYNMEVE